MIHNKVTPRVICVVYCPDAMTLIRDFVDEQGDNYNWNMDWDSVMKAAAAAARGDTFSPRELIKSSLLAKMDSTGYSKKSLKQLTTLAEAIGVAVKHALPGMYHKGDSKLIHCRYLETTSQYFVFEIQLSRPNTLGDLA